MNVQKACAILHIDAATAKDPAKLKRQYHKLALLHHPDKNRTVPPHVAEVRFKEISTAYQYLASGGCDDDLFVSGMTPKDFVDILEQFIVANYGENSLLNKIVREVVYIYEAYTAGTTAPDLMTTIGERIRELDDDVLNYVFDFICRYRHLLRIASAAVDALEKIVNVRRPVVYRLRPTLADILACRLYKLTVDGAVYYVPLWERINYFDMAGADASDEPKKTLTVLCDPLLVNGAGEEDNTVRIDDGVLYIWATVSFETIRVALQCGGVLQVAGGAVEVPLEMLRITDREQEIQLKGAGVPYGSVDDIQRGDAIVYIRLV